MIQEDDILVTDQIFRLKPRHLDLKRIRPLQTTGFASPATTHFKRALDINDLVIKHPEATYFMIMTTHAMKDMDIPKGCFLVVDSAEEVYDEAVIVTWVEGGYRVRQVKLYDQLIVLYAAHPDYPPLYVNEFDEYEYFGVVTFTINRVQPWNLPT